MKLTWKRYLTECEKHCPADLSLSMLLHTVPFYQAYLCGVSAKDLMADIKHVSDMNLSAEERLRWLSNRIRLVA